MWASENAVKGNGMKSARFEAAVCEQYNRLVENKLLKHPQWTHQDLTGSAIVQQYKKVKKECRVFEGHICSAKAMNPTGDPSEEDFIRFACEGDFTCLFEGARLRSLVSAPLMPSRTCSPYEVAGGGDEARVLVKGQSYQEEYRW
jgi:hypothetical protein